MKRLHWLVRLWAVATALLVVPLLFGAGGSRVADGPALSLHQVLQVAWNSLVVSMGAAALATAVAVPVALVAMRLEGRRLRALLLSGATAPLLVSTPVIAVVAMYMLGPTGWFTSLLTHGARTWEVSTPLTQATLALKPSPIYTLPGTALTMAFAFLPLAVLGLAAALARGDPDAESAGLLEAGPAGVLWRITLPGAAGGIATSLALVFLFSLVEFAIPEALRSQPLLVAEVYIQFGVWYDPRTAALCALVIAVLAMIGLALLAAILGRLHPLAAEPMEAGAVSPLRATSPASRVLRWSGRGLAVLPVTIMVGTLVATMDGPTGRLATFRETWATTSGEFGFTLRLAAIGSVVSAIVGIVLGHGMAASEHRWRARTLVAATLVLPAPVIAVALRVLTSLPRQSLPMGIDDALAALAPTTVPLLVAWTLRFAPLVAFLCEHQILRIPAHRFDAARLEGAGPWGTFVHVTLPVLRPSIFAGLLLVFGLCLGEVGAAILLIPPGPTTLGIRLMTLMHYAPTSQVSALCLLIVVPALIALALGIRARGHE